MFFNKKIAGLLLAAGLIVSSGGVLLADSPKQHNMATYKTVFDWNVIIATDGQYCHIEKDLAEGASLGMAFVSANTPGTTSLSIIVKNVPIGFSYEIGDARLVLATKDFDINKDENLVNAVIPGLSMSDGDTVAVVIAIPDDDIAPFITAVGSSPKLLLVLPKKTVLEFNIPNADKALLTSMECKKVTFGKKKS